MNVPTIFVPMTNLLSSEGSNIRMLLAGLGILQGWSIQFLSGLIIMQVSADKGLFFLNADGMGSSKEQMIISSLAVGTEKFVGITCVFLGHLVLIRCREKTKGGM